VELFVHNLANVDKYIWRGTYVSTITGYGWLPQPRTVGMELRYDFKP